MLAFLNLLLISSPWLALAAVDFSDFNICPQTFLKQYVPSDCDYGSATLAEETADWECLCTSSSFLDQSSQAIWEICGCSDLEATASTLADYCTEVDYPINGAESYVLWGDNGVSPCVAPSSGSSKMNTGDIVGIVVGVITFIALVVALVQLAAAIGWISPKYKPWPQIVKILCCGTVPVEDQKTKRQEREEKEEMEKKKKEKEELVFQRTGELERGPAPEYFGRMGM